MKIFILIITLIFPLQVFSKKIELPRIKIEKAIEIARDHANKKYKVFPNGFILTEVKFINIYNKYKKAHWEIKWNKHPRTKGGWFIVRVYNNGKTEIVYGK